MKTTRLASVFLLCIFISSCGSGSSGGGNLTGKVALTGTVSTTGDQAIIPTGSTVTIKDANGKTASANTLANGTYSVDVSGLTAPLIVQIPNPAGGYFYSVALTSISSGTANVDPVSDMIVRDYYQSNGTSVDTVFSTTTGALPNPPKTTDIEARESVLRQTLAPYMTGADVNPANFNLITTPFNADHTGFDLVLDNLTVTQPASPGGNVTIGLAGGGASSTILTVGNSALTTITPPPAPMSDIVVPTPPGAITATRIASTQVVLSWVAATDNNQVAGYKVYRNSAQVGIIDQPFYIDGVAPSSNACYTVSAYDAVGNNSGQNAQVCASTSTVAADTTPPSQPALTATDSTSNPSSQIDLSWTASTDNVAVAGYRVMAGGAAIASLPATSTTYSHIGLNASTQYNYTVVALDTSGNVTSSAVASATTGTKTDTTPPSTPTGLAATAMSDSRINLAWTASADNVGVAGYNVYVGSTLIGASVTSSFSNVSLTASTQYCYTVKAYDVAGNLSSASTQVCATTQAVNYAGIYSGTLTTNVVSGTFSVTVDSAGTMNGSINVSGSTAAISGQVSSGGIVSFTLAGKTDTYSGTINATTGAFAASCTSGCVDNPIFTGMKQTTVVGAKFAIATNPTVPASPTGAGQEDGVSTAFDGTNYMVGIKGDSTTTHSVAAQLMDSSGNLVGSLISTGRNGGTPDVAFNGTNYLMVWPDEATNPNVIYGEVLSKTGTVVKAPFAISTTVGDFSGMKRSIICLGGICRVMWADSTTKAVYGRDIDSSGGFFSNEFGIESGTAAGFPGGDPFAACDASGNCLVVYDTGTDIRGSIGNATTVIKNTFVIATKAPVTVGCTDSNPSPVVFDGTNYLVVWNDHSDCFAGAPEWDVLAQRIDASGNMIGTPFQVNSASTTRAAMPSVAFDGTNSLVTWTDGRNDANKNGVCDAAEGTCYDVYGQYISKAGTLVGLEFVINNDAGNQVGVVTGFDNGKYLALINMMGTGAWVFDDVYGVFITP